MLKSLALDRIFHALSDPTRRLIVEELCDGETSVLRLAESLPVGLPTVLNHLKVLERSGLICTRKIGRIRRCCIEPQAFRILDQWVTPRRRVWDRRDVRRGAPYGGMSS